MPHPRPVPRYLQPMRVLGREPMRFAAAVGRASAAGRKKWEKAARARKPWPRVRAWTVIRFIPGAKMTKTAEINPRERSDRANRFGLPNYPSCYSLRQPKALVSGTPESENCSARRFEAPLRREAVKWLCLRTCGLGHGAPFERPTSFEAPVRESRNESHHRLTMSEKEFQWAGEVRAHS
jgi:hypothetical protein